MPPETAGPPVPPFIRCRRFLTAGARAGERVLDIGCGDGDLMRELAELGCQVVGVEVDPQLVAQGVARGLEMHSGFAEQLPFESGSFDRIVCSVVIPYTDERRAVQEWSRVLRPGGEASATFHGVGYGLYYLLHGVSMGQRIYGARMLVNSFWYWLTRHRLPGFLGDTLCETPGQLAGYYSRCGLDLEEEQVVDRCCGFPRFFGHRVSKRASGVPD